MTFVVPILIIGAMTALTGFYFWRYWKFLASEEFRTDIVVWATVHSVLFSAFSFCLLLLVNGALNAEV